MTTEAVQYPTWKKWALTIRPKTLTQSTVPVIAATLFAYSRQQIDWSLSFIALLVSLLIQHGSHLINDALDFKKGSDTATRIGPIRPLQRGLLTFQEVYVGGLVTLALALLVGIPLMMAGGMPLVLALFTSAAMAYLYTGGPFPLAYTGLSDLFVFLFYGLCCMGGVFYALTLTYDPAIFLLSAQMGLMSVVMLIVVNLRDVKDDTKVNKRTLVVRFGTFFARLELILVSLLPFALNAFWLEWGYKGALLSFLALPLALKLLKNVWQNEPGPIYNNFMAVAGLLNLSFALLLAIGLTFF